MTELPAGWVEDFEAAERYLLERSDWRTDTPAALYVVDGPQSAVKVAALIKWLRGRGWRVGYDYSENEGLWFFPPGPMSDPGDETRLAN